MMNLYFKKRKKILKKAFVGLTLFVLGVSLLYGLARIPTGIFPTPWLSHRAFPIFVMTLIFVLLYKPLERLYEKLFRNYLFKNKINRHITLMNLT